MLHTVLGTIFFVLELDLDELIGALCRVRISCTDNGGESPWLKHHKIDLQKLYANK